MKKDDIVYFREPYQARYSDKYHHFYPNIKYQVIDGGSYGTCVILDASDMSYHFISGDGYNKIITVQQWRDIQLGKLGIEEYEENCYICHSTNVDSDFICDMCEQLYCEDCSYTFSLHYQHQGSRCYNCADQSRRTPLNKRDIKLNKLFLKNKK